MTKASGKLWLDENSTEYTAENPLVLTYGTEDTEFPVVLKNSDGNEINEELIQFKCSVGITAGQHYCRNRCEKWKNNNHTE